MRFGLVDAAKKDFPAQRLCKVLGVCASGYFAWKSRPACRRPREDRVLLAHVRSAFTLSNGTYGSPRMVDERRYNGLTIVLRQRRQAVGAASEVDRLRRHKNPNARGNRNPVAAFTARSTFVSVATSVPELTRTTAAPSAISIVPHGIAQEAAEDGAAASTITGAKVTLPAAAPGRQTAPRCASPRQPNSCCGVRPCRHATAETLSPIS